VEWVQCDVMRVGYVPHAALRQLDVADDVVVLLPGSAPVSVDAAVPGRRYSAQVQGRCVSVLPPCARLSLEGTAPGSTVVISLDPSFVESAMAATQRSLCGQASSVDPFLTRMGSTFASAFRVHRAPPPDYLRFVAEEVRDHLCRFYSRRRRSQVTRPLATDRLERATQYMREEFADKDLSVADVALSVGLSGFHFTRMFTKATGKAPHAFLTQIRLEHARRLLGETCLPIAEIANRCGYATHAHFTGVFGRHVGMTPANYRTHVRAERAAARAASAGNR
jgi:AraC-like DNA-binding protein